MPRLLFFSTTYRYGKYRVIFDRGVGLDRRVQVALVLRDRYPRFRPAPDRPIVGLRKLSFKRQRCPGVGERVPLGDGRANGHALTGEVKADAGMMVLLWRR